MLPSTPRTLTSYFLNNDQYTLIVQCRWMLCFRFSISAFEFPDKGAKLNQKPGCCIFFPPNSSATFDLPIILTRSSSTWIEHRFYLWFCFSSVSCSPGSAELSKMSLIDNFTLLSLYRTSLSTSTHYTFSYSFTSLMRLLGVNFITGYIVEIEVLFISLAYWFTFITQRIWDFIWFSFFLLRTIFNSLASNHFLNLLMWKKMHFDFFRFLSNFKTLGSQETLCLY